MKRVLIDLYKAKLPYSGLGQFSLHLADHLQKQPNSGFEFHFLFPTFEPQLIPSKRQFHKADWKRRHLPSFGTSFDLWHSLHQFPSHNPPPSTPQILTIHDLNFLVEKSERKAYKYLDRLQKNVNKASILTTISQFTKEEIIKHLELGDKKIHVIYNGIPRIDQVEKTPPKGIDKSPFLFTLGILSAKKNFHTLLPMMQQMPTLKLFIAGDHQTSYGTELKKNISSLGLEKQVVLLGKVSEQEKQWLYSECVAFVFPSIAEGFGMPVIEAMQAGKLVVCSDYSALPEIGGSVARYFRSFDPINMSKTVQNEIDVFNNNKIERVLEAQAYAQKFSWTQCSKAYIELYKEVLNVS